MEFSNGLKFLRKRMEKAWTGLNRLLVEIWTLVTLPVSAQKGGREGHLRELVIKWRELG